MILKSFWTCGYPVHFCCRKIDFRTKQSTSQHTSHQTSNNTLNHQWPSEKCLYLRPLPPSNCCYFHYYRYKFIIIFFFLYFFLLIHFLFCLIPLPYFLFCTFSPRVHVLTQLGWLLGCRQPHTQKRTLHVAFQPSKIHIL